MKVSKITISITIFIAVVFFRRSEGIDVEDCNSDDEFLAAVEKYKNENKFYIPIVVTKEDRTSFLDDTVESFLVANDYQMYIRVHVDNGNCPVANSVLHVRHQSLLSKEKYPKVFMMLENCLHGEMWHQESSMDINSFLRHVLTKRPERSFYVSNSVKAGIDSRNLAQSGNEASNQKILQTRKMGPSSGWLRKKVSKSKSLVKPLTIKEKRSLLQMPDESLSNYTLNRVGNAGSDPNLFSRPMPINWNTQQVPISRPTTTNWNTPQAPTQQVPIPRPTPINYSTQQVPMRQVPTQLARDTESNVGRTNSVSDLNRGVQFVDKGKQPMVPETGTEHRRTSSRSGTGYYQASNPHRNF